MPVPDTANELIAALPVDVMFAGTCVPVPDTAKDDKATEAVPVCAGMGAGPPADV